HPGEVARRPPPLTCEGGTLAGRWLPRRRRRGLRRQSSTRPARCRESCWSRSRRRARSSPTRTGTACRTRSTASVAIFVGLGFWWGLPLLSAILLPLLVVASLASSVAYRRPGTCPRRRRTDGHPAPVRDVRGFSPSCTASARP